MKLKELKDKFIENNNYYRSRYDKSQAERILDDFIENNPGLNTYDLSNPGTAQNKYGDNLTKAMPDFVKHYRHDKNIPIAIFKDFICFIEENTGISAHLKTPPIDSSNEFERLMYVAKRMQGGIPVWKMSDELWVDRRTIERDRQRLRGELNPIQVNGKKFIVREPLENEDVVFATRSTVHPLFLTENLTQVLIMLRGLYIMRQEAECASYAELTAKEIFSQLTTYARTRIIMCLKELFMADTEEITWFENLYRTVDDDTFHSETFCTDYFGDAIIELIKNRIRGYIKTNDKIYEKVLIKFNQDRNKLDLIDEDGKVFIINKNDIIASGKTKADMVSY